MNSDPEHSRSASMRWGVVVLLMFFTGLGHFNREGLAVAGNKIFITELGLTEVQMGSVYSAFLIVYTIGMLPGGWLIDRIGSGRALALFGLSMGMLVALMGTLDWFTATPLSLWIGLLVIRALTGGCNAPLHPGAAHAAAVLMPESHRPTVNGLRTAGALLGIAFSYPIFAWLIETLTWPWAFVVSGSTLMACGALWQMVATPMLTVSGKALATGDSGPTMTGKLPAASAMPPAKRVPLDGSVSIDSHLDQPGHDPILLRVENNGESDASANRLVNDRRLLRDRNLWLLTLSYAAYGYFQYLFFYWMDYYFKKVLHVPDAASQRASFYIFLAMGAGMTIGGVSTGHAGKLLGAMRGRRSIVMTGMGLGALFALLAVRMTDHQSVAICLAISMGSLGMCEGVFWTTATDIGGKSRGFAGAFMNTGGNVGGFISPVLTPFMAETMGWPGAITVACVIAGLGGLLWFVIRPSENSSTTFIGD